MSDGAVDAIKSGNVATLERLLADDPALVRSRPEGRGGRTLLHIATDWPGHLPNVAETIAVIARAGADVNAPCLGAHPETPLHWAASSGDLAAIEALLEAGADIDAPGAVIAGGTPMADATAFGEWDAARLLVARGARTNLFEAAALGLVDRVQHQLAADEPSAETITSSFWGACHGGQLATAEILLAHGADIDWVGYDQLTPLDVARRADAPDVVAWLERHGAVSADGGPTSAGRSG